MVGYLPRTEAWWRVAGVIRIEAGKFHDGFENGAIDVTSKCIFAKSSNGVKLRQYAGFCFHRLRPTMLAKRKTKWTRTRAIWMKTIEATI